MSLRQAIFALVFLFCGVMALPGEQPPDHPETVYQVCSKEMTKDCADGRPIPVKTPDPEYSDEARAAGISGTVRLAIIVGADGLVSDAAVEKSLGYGLDEQAIRAVRTWEFRPATLNGTPVAVRLRVEMNFKIYGNPAARGRPNRKPRP